MRDNVLLAENAGNSYVRDWKDTLVDAVDLTEALCCSPPNVPVPP